MPEVLEYRTSAQGPIDLASLQTGRPELPDFNSSSSAAPPPVKEAPAEVERPEPDTEEAPETTPEDNSAHSGQGNGQKPLSRYERTKRRIAAVKEREAALERRESEWNARETARAEAEKKAGEPDYTIADLKKYRKQWESNGEYDLVSKADEEIARLEQLEADKKQQFEIPKPGTDQFKAVWEQSERDLYEHDPEFMRSGTRMDKALRELFAGPYGNQYRSSPYGIFAAYNYVKLDLTLQDLAAERQKTSAYEKEIKRLNGLLG